MPTEYEYDAECEQIEEIQKKIRKQNNMSKQYQKQKEKWFNAGRKKAFQECLEIIDKCDINPCCHGLDKKEIIDKIKEKMK